MSRTPGFNAKVALAKALTEVAQQFDVHPNQIMKWKTQLLEGRPPLSALIPVSIRQPTIDVKTLHAKIGELMLENDFCPIRSTRRDC